MKTIMMRLAVLSLAATIAGTSAQAAVETYLNFLNTTVTLGPSMAADPFVNGTVAGNLANIIDAPSATSTKVHHNPSTHIWYNMNVAKNGGKPLELIFTFDQEYDLTSFHFWNYLSENYDVDNVDFYFFNNLGTEVGNVLNFEPRLGNPVSGTNPILPESYALSFPGNTRSVTAYLSGSNRLLKNSDIATLVPNRVVFRALSSS